MKRYDLHASKDCGGDAEMEIEESDDGALVRWDEVETFLEASRRDLRKMADDFTIEAKTAARWWADILRKGGQLTASTSSTQRMIAPGSCESTDWGDLCHFMISQNLISALTAQQIDNFEVVLAFLVHHKMTSGDAWEKSKTNANWGSACRILFVDYGACRELQMAYQCVGGHRPDAFPIKTMMWINHGSVKVRCGYGAPEEQVPLIGAAPDPEDMPQTPEPGSDARDAGPQVIYEG